MPHPTLRSATLDDAPAISAVLQALVAAGKRSSRADEDFVRDRYLTAPAGLQCTVATEENGRVLGFQSLMRALPDNAYGTPEGWGIIGTHIHPDGARRGIGKALFAESTRVARAHGLHTIEALIGIENTEGRAYYAAMGFIPYREDPDAVGTRFDLPAS